MTTAALSAAKVSEAARKTLAKLAAASQINPTPRGSGWKRLQDIAALADAALFEAPDAKISVDLEDFALMGSRVWNEVTWKEQSND